MARWQIADDHYYWFITVFTDEGIETDDEKRKIIDELGVKPAPGELNLWRCRHCAAMVPGDGRAMHTAFHRATNTLFYGIGEVEEKDDGA